MAGPYLRLRRELGLAIGGALDTTVSWPGSILVPRNSPVPGRYTLPHWQGFRVRIEQGMGCV